MGRTLHQQELVLSLKLTKDLYVIFHISNGSPGSSIIFSEIDFPFPGDRPKNSTKFFQGLSKVA